ncbi:MAG: alpha/beta hydrolase [Roseibium sp.]|nr:alpha/beta hydrolase [Roseibium sp.]
MRFGNGVCGAALIAAMYLGILPLGAQEIDGTRFRAPEEGTWYHSIEPESWVHIGGDRTEIEDVLTRISTSGTERKVPDDPAFQGEGSWVAEWTRAGDLALREGRALAVAGEQDAAVNRLRAAVTYFLRASSPHTDDPLQRAALKKAQESYGLLAENHELTIKEIEVPFEDRSFKAWLHLPATQGPVPVVVASMGSDVAKEELLPYFEKQLAIRGIGLLSLDMPGMGASADWRFSQDTDKIHVAAVNHLKTLPEIDGHNLFIQGASFGGHAAARAWLARPDLDIAGVLFMCGPVHSALVAPPQAYAHFPQFTMDGVRTRFGLAPDAGFDEISTFARTLSLKKQGLFDGPAIGTPIFAILTNNDPVIPLEDVDAFLSRGTNVKKVVYDTPGHCPERDSREAMAASWVQDQLR